MLVDNKMGSAGARVVIEEFLAGEEASFMVMVDGEHVLTLATSQDHKRLLDGTTAQYRWHGRLFTAPVVTPALHAKVMREVIMPTIQGMAAEGEKYTAFCMPAS